MVTPGPWSSVSPPASLCLCPRHLSISLCNRLAHSVCCTEPVFMFIPCCSDMCLTAGPCLGLGLCCSTAGPCLGLAPIAFSLSLSGNNIHIVSGYSIFFLTGCKIHIFHMHFLSGYIGPDRVKQTHTLCPVRGGVISRSAYHRSPPGKTDTHTQSVQRGGGSDFYSV